MTRIPVAALWTGCFVFAASFHAAGAAALLMRWSDPAETVASAPVVLIELAPVAASPTPVELNLPPAPQQPDTMGDKEPIKETPVEKAETKPEPVEKTEPDKKAEPVQTASIVQEPDPVPVEKPELAVMPKPRPPEPEKQVKQKQQRASLASAPSPAERRAPRQVAPAPGAVSRDANALPSWRARLAAQLERNKRYPAEARSRGDQGTAQLAFTIDRSGGVHRARIVRSSGSSILDRATLDMIARAQPLPPPPAELGGAVSISVPIRYTMR